MLQKAFTLIELLIVVAIIAILAAIAVPNFLEAQTRSKVSRVRADLRSTATALEAYAVDNTNYPNVNTNPGWALPITLTTPISYITSIYPDVFGGKIFADDLYAPYNQTKEYWYGTQKYFQDHGWNWQVNNGAGSKSPAKWGLQSKGPDQRWARSTSAGGCGVLEVDQPCDYAYDATNGTISTGNIVRTGP